MTEISLPKRKTPSRRRKARGRANSSQGWPIWAKLTASCMILYVLFVFYVILSIDVSPQRNNVMKSHQVMADSRRQTQRTSLVDAKRNSKTEYELNKEKAEEALQKFGPSAIRKTVTAYLEPPMNDTIPGTGSQGDPDNDKDHGTPPAFVVPLPLRTNTPNDLIKFEYPKLQTCHDVPGKIPVDRGLEFDRKGNPIVWNIGDEPTANDYPMQEAPFCPVDADPFLPWIHDVFPSQDGKTIQFIAQNKRRCKTGKNFRKDLQRMEPQVALMQPVSVERIGEDEARRIAPELWYPDSSADDSPRYRLAPYEESAADGQETRFICRFHATDFSDQRAPRTVLLGETLSKFPFNYEFVSYRKKEASMLTPRGKDTKMFWTSNLRFECPVPDLNGLSHMIANGDTVLSDGTPTVHVDLIPIRTPPRFGPKEAHFPVGMIRPDEDIKFDAKERWGDRNVMPRIEASGRWENIPICFPPSIGSGVDPVKEEVGTSPKRKPHTLAACLWASASFRTRGAGQAPTTDTLKRLEEWIEFHLMVGFDHIYVYDNSGAQTNETSLAPLLDRYPASKITRIDWPSIVCNNNIPAHDNTGERSSQYAAENSCRTRYAPFTEWIAAFDTDEYLIPMGKYTNLKDVVKDAEKGGTNILSFRSSRAKLRHDFSQNAGSGRIMFDHATFLDAYNCDSAPLPKPAWADRARKQIYRADYVKYHFVHYSTVTEGILQTYNETRSPWYRSYRELKPSERVTDEVNEAVMLHTKTSSPTQTANWINRCHFEFEKKWRGCFVGFAWPNGTEAKGDAGHRADGMEYNCFENYNVTNYWGPRLREALAKRQREVTVS